MGRTELLGTQHLKVEWKRGIEPTWSEGGNVHVHQGGSSDLLLTKHTKNIHWIGGHHGGRWGHSPNEYLTVWQDANWIRVGWRRKVFVGRWEWSKGVEYPHYKVPEGIPGEAMALRTGERWD